MGEEQSKIQDRGHSVQYLDNKIAEHLTNQNRLKLSHQANIWQLCHHLSKNYNKWSITQIHLSHDMIAGEVLQQLTKINFQQHKPHLKVLGLSHNDIICDNLRYFRGAFFNTLIMLYLDNNKIGSDGCYYISKTSLKQLQTLDLSHNLIKENAAGHLANSNLPSLINLIISNNSLSYTGLTMFGRAEWPALAFLQAKQLAFEPTKEMENIKFRTEVKMFRLELQ